MTNWDKHVHRYSPDFWERGGYSYALNDNNKFLEDVFRITFGRRRFSCVYMIGDFYVGQTTHLRQRLLCHIRMALNGINHSAMYKELLRRIKSTQVIPVAILSRDLSQEEFFIKIHPNPSQLKNVIFNK